MRVTEGREHSVQPQLLYIAFGELEGFLVRSHVVEDRKMRVRRATFENSHKIDLLQWVESDFFELFGDRVESVGAIGGEEFPRFGGSMRVVPRELPRVMGKYCEDNNGSQLWIICAQDFFVEGEDDFEDLSAV